jgi:hypothetical protein
MSSNTQPINESTIVNLLIYKNHLVDTGFREKYDGLVNSTIFNAYLNTTTNELTFQRLDGDITIDYSLSGLPDVDISTTNAGDVLFWNGTKWVSENINNINPYINNNISTRFSDITSTTSVIDALNKILYPFSTPEFSIFNSTIPTGVEFGENIGSQTVTFNFQTDNFSNVATLNKYRLIDTNTSAILDNNINATLSGNIVYVNNTITTSTTPNAVQQYTLTGRDINGNYFNSTYTIKYLPRIYYGLSANGTLNSSQIIGLGSSYLTDDLAKQYVFNNCEGRYLYICLPTYMDDIMDNQNHDSRIYIGSVENNYWDKETVSFTNQFGFTSDYTLYKSKSLMYGTKINVNII